jgi:ABC-type branched-subunit amino acid transport system substrate-binding protein
MGWSLDIVATRRRLAAIALVACSAIAAACSSSGPSSTSASSHAPVKVGYLLPLTGIFTKNGTSEQDGFKLGLKHFGTSVDGHPIQVTYANDQGDPSVSLSDARQLVTSDHVQVMEGPLISSAIAVVAPYVLGRRTTTTWPAPSRRRPTPGTAPGSPPAGTASRRARSGRAGLTARCTGGT